MGEREIKVLTDEMVEAKLLLLAEKLNKHPREFMTFQEFREKVCAWSDDTLRRRIEAEGFPAIKDKGGYLIPRKEMYEWFTKRRTQP